jgi:hypothetical protein
MLGVNLGAEPNGRLYVQIVNGAIESQYNGANGFRTTSPPHYIDTINGVQVRKSNYHSVISRYPVGSTVTVGGVFSGVPLNKTRRIHYRGAGSMLELE